MIRPDRPGRERRCISERDAVAKQNGFTPVVGAGCYGPLHVGASMSPSGAKATSLCCRRPVPGITREFHQFRFGSDDVHREIVDAVYSVGKGAVRHAEQVGVILATLRIASEGGLPTGDDLNDELEPARTQNGLWELKWKKRRGATAEFRMYHAEPDGGAPDFVALRFHVKDDAGTAAEIDAAQDREMRTAADRYKSRAAAAARWGHEARDCPSCVRATP